MPIHQYASLETTDGARIVKRLCNHWKHKFDIIEEDEKFYIPFPDAQVILSANDAQIFIDIRTEKANVVTQYQDVVVNHLNRMAQQEFTVDWQSK